jgi:hypothetical protein
VRDHDIIRLATWLGMLKSLTLVFSHMMNAREMSDTLTIIRDVMHIADEIVARHTDMTKDEIVHEVMRIANTGRPALTYQIARRRRGKGQGRQQG